MDRVHSSREHPHRYAAAAFLIVLPTTLFFTFALLRYFIGVAGVLAALEPGVTALVSAPLVDLAIALAPYLALSVAVIPVVRPDLRWAGGRMTGSVEFAVPLANAVVALVSAALIVVMAGYLVLENR